MLSESLKEYISSKYDFLTEEIDKKEKELEILKNRLETLYYEIELKDFDWSGINNKELVRNILNENNIILNHKSPIQEMNWCIGTSTFRVRKDKLDNKEFEKILEKIREM